MAAVLAGTVVLDLGTFITGPCAAQILAELGAEVIKVENPRGGDPFRGFSEADGGYSPQFQAYNRHKKSVAIDLADPAGRERFVGLARQADVLIENFRPGVMQRLGLDTFDAPRLIHCSITGFGSDGPYAARPAYDTVALAMGGLMSQLLDPGQPRIAGPAMADALTGLYAAIGVLGALVERAGTGRGRRVEVAMMEAVAAFATEPFAQLFAGRPAPGPYARASVSQSFAFPCADGKLVALHLSSPPKFFQALCAAIDAPNIAADPRFAGREDRVTRFGELTDALAPYFLARPRHEWLALLDRHDVPFAPVLTLPEVVADEQAVHAGLFPILHHPARGDVRGVACPIRYDGEREKGGAAPPELGEHTHAVLQRFGIAS